MICVKHPEWRQYIPEGTQISKCRFGNAYYHFNSSCIKLQFPDFVPNHLQVPEDLYLSEAHKERLQHDFSVCLVTFKKWIVMNS